MRRATALLSAAAALLGPAAAARAQADGCVPPDLLETIPAEAAIGVPTDATLIGRYAITALYQDEFVVVEGIDGAAPEIEVTYAPGEGALRVRPLSGWAPGGLYYVSWPALFAVDGTGPGSAAVTTFRAGAGPDVAPPRFDGIEALTWDVDKPHDECTDSAPERFYFALALGAATDDGGLGALELVVFQTAAPDLLPSDPPRPIGSLLYPGAGELASFSLPRASSLGHVCFSALARDLSGNASPASAEVCTTTRRPPFWEGCSVASARPASGSRALLGWWPLALAVLLRRRMRRGARAEARARRHAPAGSS